MALKDLLVYVDQSESSEVRLRLGADLASRHGCRLTALYVEEPSHAQHMLMRAGESGLASFEQMDRARREARTAIGTRGREQHAALEQLGRERGIAVEWRSVVGQASTVVPQHARYCDLCILGQESVVDLNSVDYSFAERMLFTTGRPVLFVPAGGSFTTLGRRILVAWNSSRPAARALNDALPLIERAEHTTVVTINAKTLPVPKSAPPLDEVLAHLQRHGAPAEVLRIENRHQPVAALIQEQALLADADLIVAGAFGHPQLWEKILGGVTRDLLAGMSMPVFMSH